MKPLAAGLLSLALLLLVAPGAEAQRRGERARQAGRSRMAEDLGLSQAQREQLRAVARQHKDGLRAQRATVHDARQALRAVMQAAPQDAGALRAAAGTLEHARTELLVARGARRAELQDSLTPEQRTRAAELKQQRQADRADRKADRKAGRADRKAGRMSGHGARGPRRK